jgi:hypothetical protein
MELVFESQRHIDRFGSRYPEVWKSVFRKDEVKMKTLLEGGANTESMGEFEFTETTPLQLAVETNQIRMVEMLLKHGANVHVRTNFGNTLLHTAMSIGSSDMDSYGMVRVLQKNHAVVDATNYMGWTALHEATMMANIRVIGYLMGCNADVTLKTRCGQTASEITLCSVTKDVLVKAEEAHFNDRRLAFAMGHHKRLGQGTKIIDLHPELLRMVLQYRGA